jgi:hypothetical protein
VGSVIAARASGIRGYVKGDDGNVLAYATIYVKQTGSGTTTNDQGYFEITLKPGLYDLIFQYVGYESIEKSVEVSDGFIDLNLTLKTQIIQLREVVVKAGQEDPAYTIMRKAIAKAKYHTQEVDSMAAQVYIKGVGKLKDYPWLFKKEMEKEGIEKNRAFVSESVSEIKYKRPATFEEKVISIRSSGKDNNTSPNAYIFGSFYQPYIANTVSPLSPKAFSYYRFEYQGTFKDRNYEVSKIKVIPRSKGDDVLEGMLFIVEDWWSIHSLDLRTTKLGISISVKQVYAPIEDKSWQPVSHKFLIDGKFFGFEFEYNYLATVSNYKLFLNPELVVEEMEVIDDKLEKQRAKEVESKFSKEAQQLQERVAAGKEITRKELKKIVKEYEKQELRQQKEPEVTSNVKYKVDTAAYKLDSAYWATIRPVPLSADEVIGYKKTDSLAVAEQKKEAGDSLKPSKHKGFQLWDLIAGDNYKLGKRSNFVIEPLQSYFNTVEGYNLIYKVRFGIPLGDSLSNTRLTITPVFRYAFEREKASGYLSFVWQNYREFNRYKLEVRTGRYISQYNHDEPILPIVNTLTTLLGERNLMKIYERDFVDVHYSKRMSAKITYDGSLSWAQRRELFNTSNLKWIDRTHREYTPNRPVNAENINTGFATHEALIATAGITAKPWVKFRIRNGYKREIENSSPAFSARYTKGFSKLLSSDIDFDFVETGIKHNFQVGVRGRVSYALSAGLFVNKDSLAFMDYKHFLGNRTPFSTNDPVGSFRLLDYYAFSTGDRYFSASVYYQFRKFLITTIPFVRMAGIRENVFVNYLATPSSKNYTELGYSLDGILRIFRIEAAASFLDGRYLTYGFRIGIASNITVRFSDN